MGAPRAATANILTVEQSTAQVVDGSTYFNMGLMNTAYATYLTRTPSSDGNRKTYTISVWCKRNQLKGMSLGNGYTANTYSLAGANDFKFLFESTRADALTAVDVTSSTDLTTNPIYRDIEAWYHVVLAVDTTQGTNTNRTKIYVNGAQVTSLATSTYPAQDAQGDWGDASYAHYLARTGSGDHFDGNLCQYYFLDGQALTPSDFGYTDPLTNVWRPKKFAGSYGTVGGTPTSGTLPNYNSNNSLPTYSNQGGTQGGLGAGPISNGFDSNNGTYVNMTYLNGQWSKLTFASAITNVTKIVVGYDGEGDVGYNGSVVNSTVGYTGSAQTITLRDSSAVTLTDLYFVSQPGSGVCRLYWIKITTTGVAETELTFTAGVANNSFYLPLDGSLSLGKDQSPCGNDWTEVNFTGGNVSLDRATGGLPILNTVCGGRTASVGVFGSGKSATYKTTSASNSGGKYVFDDGLGTQPTFNFVRGATYTFDWSASSSHPLRFATAADAAGSTEYTDGTNVTGNVTTITVPHNAPDRLYYYCNVHNGMGNSISVTDTTKTDSYAWKNVLALPLVGIATDVSNRLNIGSTEKILTVTNAVANSSISNFYGGSFYFDGNGDYLDISANADFAFGAGDFTVECWIYNEGVSATGNIIDCRTGSGAGWGVQISSYNEYLMFYSEVSASSVLGNMGPIPEDRWTHIAITRASGTLYGFINGVLQTSASHTSNYSTNIPCVIGARFSKDQQYFNGRIQDVRVYKGAAKYTSDFIVATPDGNTTPESPSGVSLDSQPTKLTTGSVGFDGTGDYLRIASSSDFDQNPGTDFTAECFFYMTATSGPSHIFGFQIDASNRTSLYFTNNTDTLNWWTSLGGSNGNRVSAYNVSINVWHHVAVTRSGSTTTMWLDGVSQGTSTTTDYPNGSQLLDIGTYNAGGSAPDSFPGFISNVRYVKGTAVYTANFTPPTSLLNNITNTKLLCCQSTWNKEKYVVSPGAITANGDAYQSPFNPFDRGSDAAMGRPSGYATWNSLKMGTSDVAMNEGNLVWFTTSNGPDKCTYSTIGMDSGKFYWENEIIEATATGVGIANGLANDDGGPAQAHNWMYYSATGQTYFDGTGATYGEAFNTNGIVIGVAFDRDNLTLEFFREGVSQGKLSSISGLTATETYYAMIGDSGGASQSKVRGNFGQRPFKYQPPEGFLPLNYANLPRPKAVLPATQYFKPVLYSGDGNSGRYLDFGFTPDLAMFKSRTTVGYGWEWYDSVRGPQKAIYSNLQNAEATESQGLLGFISRGSGGGVTIGNNNWVNNGSSTYVTYGWKAGGNKNTFNVDDVGYASAAAAGMAGGDITPTGCSVGTKQGFSIIKYSGNSTNNQTISHGLGRIPTFCIVKNLTESNYWVAKSIYNSTQDVLYPNSDEAEGPATGSQHGIIDDFSSSTTVNLKTNATNYLNVNQSGDDYIMYIWTDIPGVQKFGAYNANNSTNGPYVDLGFKPAFVCIKCMSAGGGSYNWALTDSTRSYANVANHTLAWNLNNPESSFGGGESVFGAANMLDLLSNGFKIRDTGVWCNASSQSYVYMAWAESPMRNLYGARSTAR